MTTIKLAMSESDIVRARNAFKKEYNPITYLASRLFREDLDNVDAKYDNILIWDDSTNDYRLYKYCTEDISNVNNFLTEWEDFIDGYIDDFNLKPIEFCVEELK